MAVLRADGSWLRRVVGGRRRGLRRERMRLMARSVARIKVRIIHHHGPRALSAALRIPKALFLDEIEKNILLK